MGWVIDDYKRQIEEREIEEDLKGQNLTEEEIKAKPLESFKRFSEAVEKKANKYEGLDMDTFIRRIGGQEKIDEMKEINTRADKLSVVNGKTVQKEVPQSKEDLEEWKKGFMDGFEEAYKRLYGK